MRIIGGLLKGKKIKFLKNTTTRPLKDSVKENIFNILTHSNVIKTKIENSDVLDLYSGVGSFGIECISRGSQKVTFIEKDKNAFDALRENLQYLSIGNKTNIFFNDIEKILKNKIDKKFNIFFFDPPFNDFKFIRNLKIIKNLEIFKNNHIIIIHRERGTIDNFTGIMNIINIKEYGRSKIIFGVFN